MITVQQLQNHYTFAYFLQNLSGKELARLMRIRDKYGSGPFQVEISAFFDKHKDKKWREEIVLKAKKQATADWLRMTLVNTANNPRIKTKSETQKTKLNFRKDEVELLKKTLWSQITALASFKILEAVRDNLGGAEVAKIENILGRVSKDEGLAVIKEQLGLVGLDWEVVAEEAMNQSQEETLRLYFEEFVDLVRAGKGGQ